MVVEGRFVGERMSPLVVASSRRGEAGGRGASSKALWSLGGCWACIAFLRFRERCVRFWVLGVGGIDVSWSSKRIGDVDRNRSS